MNNGEHIEFEWDCAGKFFEWYLTCQQIDKAGHIIDQWIYFTMNKMDSGELQTRIQEELCLMIRRWFPQAQRYIQEHPEIMNPLRRMGIF